MAPHLVICKDEMTNGSEAEEFQKHLWDMFNVQFPPLLTMPQIDRIRRHLFPEIRITQGGLFGPSEETKSEHDIPYTSDAIVRVMDLNQEQLLIARNLGEGHRVDAVRFPLRHGRGQIRRAVDGVGSGMSAAAVS